MNLPDCVTTLKRGVSELVQTSEALSRIYVHGIDINWQPALPEQSAGSTPQNFSTFPTYAFQRKRYWLTDDASADTSSDVPGAHQEIAGHGDIWTRELNLRETSPLVDHCVLGRVVVPASEFIATVAQAIGTPVTLTDLSIEQPMWLDQGQSKSLQLLLHRSNPDDGHLDEYRSFEILSRDQAGDSDWQSHVSGRATHGVGIEPAQIDLSSLNEKLEPGPEPVEFYQRLADRGLELGPAFQLVRSLRTAAGQALGELSLHPEPGTHATSNDARFLGTLLDCVTQVAAAVPAQFEMSDLFLPVHYERVVFDCVMPHHVFCYVRQRESQHGSDTDIFDIEIIEPGGRVVGRVDGFSAKRAPAALLRRDDQVNTTRLIYDVHWKQVEPDDSSETSVDAAPWLILGGSPDEQQTLKEQLDRLAVNCMVVEDSHVFGRPSRWHFQLDRQSPDHFEQLLDEVANDFATLSRIVVLPTALPSIETESLDSTTRFPEQRLSSDCGGLLHLCSNLVHCQLAVDSICVVTRGGQRVDQSGGDPVGASVWGLARSIAAEYPDLRFQLVDLDPRHSTLDDASLTRLLAGPDKHHVEVALRNQDMYQPRLTSLSPSGEAQLEIRNDRTYLVTGGLGSLGALAVNWLNQQGAGRVVAVGRNRNEKVLNTLTNDANADCEIQFVSLDLADHQQLEQLVDRLGRDEKPLAGVIHTAGVLDDGVVTEQNWQRFENVFAPKARGAWSLHQVTRGLSLDFFVLYSSAVSLMGSAGQCNYAAANAFLDGLAEHRRGMGLPATSICWGPWETGMTVGGSQNDPRTVSNLSRWQQAGVRTLGPNAGLTALSQLAQSKLAVAAVIDANWTRLIQSAAVPAAEGLLQELASTPSATDEPRLEGLDQLNAAQRLARLGEFVQQQVVDILQLSEAPEPKQGFFELGMDSLMAVELRNRIQQSLGTSHQLSATLAFDHPSIDALTRHLSDSFDTKPAKKEIAVRVMPPTDDAVAIVGLSCRFPGAANADEFWRLLSAGRDAISEVPADRWNIDEFYDPDPDTPGKMSTRFGGFINEMDQFDPRLFGVSPREAISMDPQQRLLLEVSWEALEDAGIAVDRLEGSATGVFMGMGTFDYALMASSRGLDAVDPYLGTGTTHSASVGRLSYTFGFQGPCFAIDTACSSSLVALNQASQSLLNGDCDLALAGGVNALLWPEATIYFSNAHMMAPDGRCKTFDEQANGYVRGEGCGIVVLKRLTDAQRDRDRILAIVRGSAVNQDGRSSGLTVPNGPAQERVIAEALAKAGVQPAEVDYVEAHGTGTSLGDPIEVQALAATLASGRGTDDPLLIGSVKTNIGHLEAAAGIAGVIKVVLAMNHGQLPPHLNLNQLTSHIPWEQISVDVNRQLNPWPDRNPIRTAGVSSFAFSGTNAHVVLQSPPAPEANESDAEPTGHDDAGRDRCVMIPLSAKSRSALTRTAERICEWIQAHSNCRLTDVAYTLSQGRSHQAYRTAFVASTADEYFQLLSDALVDETRIDVHKIPKAPRVAIVFGDATSEAPSLGEHSELPELADTLQRLGRTLDPTRERIASLDDPTFWTDPRKKVLEQLVRARMIERLDIQIDVVAGIGSGFITAAWLAGGISLDDCLQLHVSRLSGRGFADSECQPSVVPLIDAAGTIHDPGSEMEPADLEYLVNVDASTTSIVRALSDHKCSTVIRDSAANLFDSEDDAETPAVPIATIDCDATTLDQQGLPRFLSELYTAGVPFDFREATSDWHANRIQLPTYAFDHQRYWLDVDPSDTGRQAESHPDLGDRVSLAHLNESVYLSKLSKARKGYLFDHCVFGVPVVPAAHYLSLVIQAVGTNCALSNVVIPEALVLSNQRAQHLQLTIAGSDREARQFTFHSSVDPGGDAGWTLHSEGLIQPQRQIAEDSVSEEPLDLKQLQQRLAVDTAEQLYTHNQSRGLELGPSFRGIHRL